MHRNDEGESEREKNLIFVADIRIIYSSVYASTCRNGFALFAADSIHMCQSNDFLQTHKIRTIRVQREIGVERVN